MSLEHTARAVAGRLSLREPQAESLRRLAAALEAVPALRDHRAREPHDLEAMLEALKELFPTLTDFERDFPSLCFALATSVGKTRLMGAFISYLKIAYGTEHFFVLAPNLTIYEKLIRDFTPGSPKYVFKGIAEFATRPPDGIVRSFEAGGIAAGMVYIETPLGAGPIRQSSFPKSIAQESGASALPGATRILACPVQRESARGEAVSTTSNSEQFDRARKVLVGGVNSAVRAFRAVGGTPRFIAKAEGAYLWDVEGRRYIDYLGSWGPMIIGHSHPRVVKAVQEAALRGLSFGAPNMMETELAEAICSLFSHVDRVRFTSSGTEATMAALRLARGYTKRAKIIKFEGCYHGTADSLLVKAGSGALAFGTPSSAGVPEDVVRHTLVAQFNDLQSVRGLFEQHPEDIACLIVEPVAGNMNLILPAPGFLQGLRDLCDQYHAILIFDEVMTGFRVALGGAQARFDVTADLTAFGKVIGGGMPVGAVGGPALVMDLMAPLGPVYQAGTLSGNPIAMAAGLATLEVIGKPGFYDRIENSMKRLVDGLNAAAEQAGVAFCAQSCGAMGGIYMRAMPPESHGQALDQDIERFKRFYHLMLDGGIYLPPSPVEAFFLSSAHTAADIDQTIDVAARALKQVGQ